MRAETGQGERDGRRDRASAESAQRERGLYQGTCCVHFPLAFSLAPVLLIFTVYFTHQELMQGQEETMQTSSKESEAEMRALQEELQLALKKEREAQVSV